MDTGKLEQILRKEDSRFRIFSKADHSEFRGWRTPATVYHGENQLFAVPKGTIPDRTIRNSDGSIEVRGMDSIIQNLKNMRLIRDWDRFYKNVRRANAGMVI